MKNYHHMSVVGLVMLGLTLMLHPLWINVQEPFYAGTYTVSQHYTDLGWIYFLVGLVAAILVYGSSHAPTTQRALLAIILLFPAAVTVLQIDGLQLTEAGNLEDSFMTTLTLFPVALAFPIGVAVRTHHLIELMSGLFLWLVTWMFLPIYSGNTGAFIENIFSLQFMSAFGGVLFLSIIFIPVYIFVGLYALPPFFAGLFLGSEFLKNSSRRTSGFIY